MQNTASYISAQGYTRRALLDTSIAVQYLIMSLSVQVENGMRAHNRIPMTVVVAAQKLLSLLFNILAAGLLLFLYDVLWMVFRDGIILRFSRHRALHFNERF